MARFLCPCKILSKFLYRVLINFRSEKVNLPAGGYWEDQNHVNVVTTAYSWSTKWSGSSLAIAIFTNNKSYTITADAHPSRYTGLSVRASIFKKYSDKTSDLIKLIFQQEVGGMIHIIMVKQPTASIVVQNGIT